MYLPNFKNLGPPTSNMPTRQGHFTSSILYWFFSTACSKQLNIDPIYFKRWQITVTVHVPASQIPVPYDLVCIPFTSQHIILCWWSPILPPFPLWDSVVTCASETADLSEDWMETLTSSNKLVVAYDMSMKTRTPSICITCDLRGCHLHLKLGLRCLTTFLLGFTMTVVEI